MANHPADSSPSTTIDMTSTKVLLSTLWVFAVFNYLYADVVTLMDSEMLKMIMAGQVGSMRMTRGLLLGAAVLVETAIAMVLLSRVLEYTLNRWANIIAGVIHTAAVALSLVLGGGTPTLLLPLLRHYRDRVHCVHYLVRLAMEVSNCAYQRNCRLTRACSRQARTGQSSLRARRSQWPNSGSVDLCGR